MPRLAALTFAAVLAFAATTPLAAAEREAPERELAAPAAMKDSEARKLVKACDTALKASGKVREPGERRQAELDALEALARGRGARIARRLIEAGADDDLQPESRRFALRAVGLQGAAAAKEATRLEKWLLEEAKADREAMSRGRIGLPVDRNGDAITDTPEAERALRAGEARAEILAEGLAALRALERVPKKAEDVLEPFLQSPYDALAVAAVETAQAWDAQELAESVCLLLRMYPRENRWETGAVTHLGGTNASAKAAWMTLFGHPQKQRPRPRLNRAVVACLSAWAGTPIADPESAGAWLATRR